jgi:hypothetical protein
MLWSNSSKSNGVWTHNVHHNLGKDRDSNKGVKQTNTTYHQGPWRNRTVSTAKWLNKTLSNGTFSKGLWNWTNVSRMNQSTKCGNHTVTQTNGQHMSHLWINSSQFCKNWVN